MLLACAFAWQCLIVQQGTEPIRIVEQSSGCFHDDEKTYEWVREGQDYVRDAARIPAGEIEGIRSTLLGCRKQPDDLLAQVGFTPTSLAEHWHALLDLVAPPTWRDSGGRPKPLPSDVVDLLSYERLSKPVLDELLGRNWASTEHHRFVLEIPGDPALHVESTGPVPWMLPWKITAGADSWEVADLAVPRAILKLADPKGPCSAWLDGSGYWALGFWKDEDFWDRFVGQELTQRLVESQSPQIPGFAAFEHRFRIVKASTGAINLQPLSAFYQLESKSPGLVDLAWWWNPIENGAPTRNWNDFLQVFDDVGAVALHQTWLADWKAAGSDRHVEAHIVGVTPQSETMIRTLVQPAWDDARLAGTPEVELLLRRGDKWCGTLFLAHGEARALITTAHAGTGEHWFDELEFSFHPRSNPPTYALVDAKGHCEVRTMQPNTK